MMKGGTLRDAEQIQERIESLSEIGVDELCLWPLSSDPGQVDRIADAAGI